VAGKSPFRGIVFCNLGTPKTVLLKFATTVNIGTPYLSPYLWLPQQFSRGTKNGLADKKSLSQICINSFDERILSQDRWLCFFCCGGACGLGVGAF